MASGEAVRDADGSGNGCVVDGCVVDGGGDVEGSGLRVWADFPLAEFAGIPFRKVSIRWYIGHKLYMYNKAYVVQVVQRSCALLWLCP